MSVFRQLLIANAMKKAPVTQDILLQSLHLSDGAYFSAGYYPVPNATDTHCFMAMANNTEITRGVFGARGGSIAAKNSANVFWNVAPFQKQFRLDLLGGQLGSGQIELSTMVEFHNYSQDLKVVIDENEIAGNSATTMSNVRLTQEYLIGSFTNNTGTPFVATEMDIGSQWNISEWIDGVEVFQRKYVPVIRGTDSVVCLKDTLTNTYCEVVTGTVTAGEPVSSVVTDEYVFTSATDYDEPWVPSKYYFLSSWVVGRPQIAELSASSTNTFAIFKLDFVTGDTISVYGLGGSGTSRLYGVVNTDTDIITEVATSGENTLEEPFTFTSDYNGVIYVSIMSANGGKVTHTHAVQEVLPYAEVEYLRFSGEQWINTGVEDDGTVTMQTDVSLYVVGDSSFYITGAQTSGYSDGSIGLMYDVAHDKGLCSYCGSTSGTSANVSVENLVVNQIYTATAKNGRCCVDNVCVNTGQSHTPNSPMYLGAVNRGGTATLPGYFDAHSYKLTSGDITLREFKEVILTQEVQAKPNITGSTDGVIGEYGMWDMVNNCFFGNQGTGSFTGGDEV